MIVRQRSFQCFRLHAEECELDNKSPSFIQFSIDSNSTNKNIAVRSRSDGEVLYEMEEPITVRMAEALRSPLTYDTSYPIIDDMLSTLPLDSTERDWFVVKIISKAAEILNTDFDSQVGSKLWMMNVEIKIIREFCVEVLINELNDDDDDDDDDDEEEDDEGGMVPSNGSAIAADLEEEVKVKNNSGDCCVICLEEFPMGSYFARMPCSHVFHSNCIIKWLNTSHYCPLCRFEMPT